MPNHWIDKTITKALRRVLRPAHRIFGIWPLVFVLSIIRLSCTVEVWRRDLLFRESSGEQLV